MYRQKSEIEITKDTEFARDDIEIGYNGKDGSFFFLVTEKELDGNYWVTYYDAISGAKVEREELMGYEKVDKKDFLPEGDGPVKAQYLAEKYNELASQKVNFTFGTGKVESEPKPVPKTHIYPSRNRDPYSQYRAQLDIVDTTEIPYEELNVKYNDDNGQFWFIVKHSDGNYDAITGEIIYQEELKGYSSYPKDAIFEERSYRGKEIRSIYDFMNSQKVNFTRPNERQMVK